MSTLASILLAILFLVVAVPLGTACFAVVYAAIGRAWNRRPPVAKHDARSLLPTHVMLPVAQPPSSGGAGDLWVRQYVDRLRGLLPGIDHELMGPSLLSAEEAVELDSALLLDEVEVMDGDQVTRVPTLVDHRPPARPEAAYPGKVKTLIMGSMQGVLPRDARTPAPLRAETSVNEPPPSERQPRPASEIFEYGARRG